MNVAPQTVTSRKPMVAMVAGCLLLLLPTTGCNELKARDQLNKGVRAYKNARFDEAVEHFQKAIELEPDFKNGKLYLATAYSSQVVADMKTPENLNNANKAIGLFKEVLEKDPNDVVALKQIGGLYLDIDNIPMAEEYQKKVIALKPDDASAYYTIGQIDWKLAYNNAIAVRNSLGQQDDGSAIKDKAACARLQVQNGPLVTEGLADLTKATENRKDYSDAMAYLNLLYRRKAELECGDDSARKADTALADQWMQRGMNAKKAEEAAKAAKAGGGITINQDK